MSQVGLTLREFTQRTRIDGVRVDSNGVLVYDVTVKHDDGTTRRAVRFDIDPDWIRDHRERG